MRAHLRRHHGMVLARTPVGRLTQVEKDQAVAWYTALFEEHEQDEEEEEEEDEEEDGELEESEDDDYEESGDEDTKEEDEDE